MDDGTELRFDHGAPYFTVSNDEVARVVGGWEARGLVAEWKAMFACFDRETGKFRDFDKEGTMKKYVGVPGMNSICKSLCQEDGVVSKFGVTIGKMDWLQDRSSWSLASLDGKDLGSFDFVVATDKNIASQKVSGLTGKPPPLGLFDSILFIICSTYYHMTRFLFLVFFFKNMLLIFRQVLQIRMVITTPSVHFLKMF